MKLIVAIETLVINTSLLERASDAIEKASEMKSVTVDDAVSWQSMLASLTGLESRPVQLALSITSSCPI